MARSDRDRWNARYTDPKRALRQAPQPVLTAYAPPYHPGMRALELACGLGHDALWLAAQGYTVDAIDISLMALRKARAEMLRRGLHGVNFIVADLDQFSLPHHAYDLVVVFRFLDRTLFPAIRARVRPGGLVIYRTLNVRWREKHPETRAAHMLALGELHTFFPGWDVLHSDDSGALSELVARKPAL